MTAAETLRRGHLAPLTMDQLEQLPSIADRHHSQLYELHRAPTAERLERMATELDGLRRFLLQLRQAMRDEAAGGSAIG